MRLALLLAFLVVSGAALAADPAPHFVSLKKDEAFLREGPTYKHRVLWVYKRRGYPFQVLASYDTWRRVKDADGAVGWMHDSLLSSRRTVLVTGKGKAVIHANEAAASRIVAYAAAGAILELKACRPAACEVQSGGAEGWIAKARVWGVGADEVFK